MITFQDFQAVDIRVGRVVSAETFPEGKHSSHVLQIDCGPELGIKKSLARLVPNYGFDELVGTQVLCVVNFPPRQIGQHLSEVLTLGVPDAAGEGIRLIRPDEEVPVGGRVH